MQTLNNNQNKRSSSIHLPTFFRSYSYQPDESYVFPYNFVPDIKPRKHVSCTFSPLKLRDSHYGGKSDNHSDTEEQLKRFNFKRSHSKTISLSNASTSTDLPVIKPILIIKECYSKTQGNESSKSPFKKKKILKKRSTILVGLKRKSQVEKHLHLLNNI